MKIIYLDNASTTPCFKEVALEMKKAFNNYGNPSSQHSIGEKALKLISNARVKLASEIGARTHEIIFTSGATEANNLALFGLANSKHSGKNKIIISSIEHASVYEPCLELKKRGFEVIQLNVNKEGFVDLNELEREIDERTLIVSFIHGNNEIGVLQEIRKIGAICRTKNVLFHVDAAQTFGKEKINVRDMNISLLSASAHKIGGPKGIGFLFVKEGIEIKPIIFGGYQEHGLRSGTENVFAIIGVAKALEILKKQEFNKVKRLRDYFINKLEKIGSKINGSIDKRLFNNVNASFSGIDAEMLQTYLSQKGIMCSTSSACSEKQKAENRVLKAIGLTKNEIKGSLRFSLWFDTKKKDIDKVIIEIKKFKTDIA